MKNKSFIKFCTVMAIYNFLIILLIFPFFLESFAYGKERKVCEAHKNTSPKDKEDFHAKIRFKNNTSGKISGTLETPSETITTEKELGMGAKEVDLEWKINIPKGTEVKWRIFLNEEEQNDYRVLRAYFTPKESPTDVPALGFHVEPNGDVFLTNCYTESAISFNNLLFQFPLDITPDYMFNILDAPPSGTPGLLTSGIVSAALEPTPGDILPGELLVAQFPFLKPGDFLSGRWEAVFTDQSFSEITDIGALGHEHQVPIPAGLLLLGSGFLRLCIVGYKRKNS